MISVSRTILDLKSDQQELSLKAHFSSNVAFETMFENYSKKIKLDSLVLLTVNLVTKEVVLRKFRQ